MRVTEQRKENQSSDFHKNKEGVRVEQLLKQVHV